MGPRSSTIILLMLLAGCADGPSTGPVAIETLTTEMAGAFCEQMRRCCSEAERSSLPAAFAAVLQSKDCAGEATLQGLLDQEFNLARLKQSVMTGRSLFDPALARTCIDHLKGLSCPDWTGAMNGQAAALGAACLNMLKGTRANGESCEGNFAHECVSGTCGFVGNAGTCGPAPGAGDRCDGACEDVFDCGERCAGDLLCSPEDVCAANPAPRAIGFCRGS
jgi:hypothetical protein